MNSTINYFWCQHWPNFYNCQFSSDWLEIWRGYIFQVTDFNHQLFWRSASAKSLTLAKFLKLSIFLWFSWNLKRTFIFGHLIQPPIIFEVKFVLWILQVSCCALCPCFFCFFSVYRISQKVVNGSGWNIVDSFGGWQGLTNWILVKIRIRTRLLVFRKWFFTIER